VLPDGIFSNQNFQFYYILDCLGIDNIGIFVAIWNILPTFGVFCGHLVIFSRLGMLYQEKSGNPGANPTIASYNASVVKTYSAVNSLARL
jgi:hypothetical protein